MPTRLPVLFSPTILMQLALLMRRRWKTWVTVLGIAILIAFHIPLLRGIAGYLIVDNPIEQCDTLFLINGDRCYAIAADLYARNKVGRIALLEGARSPLVQCQIVLPEHEKQRRELLKHGVPSEVVIIASGKMRNLWELADRLSERLAVNPSEHIAIALDRFQSARLHFALKRSLTEQLLSRIRILAIRDRRFDESNWWQSRLGIKDIVTGYVLDVHMRILGRPKPFTPPEWKIELFEQQLVVRDRAS